ncbi:hypothetical protein NKJ88_05900 [Mesorhizobium sp. M0016]|uniref:hypothetical protein n=1 Tax=Mesorhizobium sp. M0016 TaxID=2956843 RepID=UPI00333BA99B
MTNFKNIFYASGVRGEQVRADGNGNHMTRGWYVKSDELHGPYASEAKARNIAIGLDHAALAGSTTGEKS